MTSIGGLSVEISARTGASFESSRLFLTERIIDHIGSLGRESVLLVTLRQENPQRNSYGNPYDAACGITEEFAQYIRDCCLTPENSHQG